MGDNWEIPRRGKSEAALEPLTAFAHRQSVSPLISFGRKGCALISLYDPGSNANMKLFGGRRERSPLRIYCDIVYSLDLDAQTRGKCLWVVLLPTVLLRGD